MMHLSTILRIATRARQLVNNSDQLRSQSPVLSSEAVRNMQISNNLSANGSKPLKIIPSSAVMPMKDACTILATLSDLQGKLNKINSTQNVILQHMECHNKRLANIEQTLGTLRATKNNSGVVKPKSVLFLTYPDLKKYDKATLEEKNEMRTWLQFHFRRTDIFENTREILQQNRLISEELILNLVWIGHRTEGDEKFPLHSRRLTYDLSKALLEMYPNSTETDVKNAIQEALKAGNSRIYQRCKNKKQSEGPAAKKRRTSLSILNSTWIPVNESSDEENTNKSTKEKADNADETA
ncbi:hypothetical protein G9C98_007348 [Cotesia typhae]|uniref:Uncharacterized protein n=2 Tax=Cotesia typhae TaxID=2053667 RepID=A0A8J5UZ83_9HYME|nr:hypothetical protein G9C98_007348 [Cotesia typhae]